MRGRKSDKQVSTSQRKRWLEILQSKGGAIGAGQSNNSADQIIIVDTNILLSALLFGGNPEIIVRHTLSKRSFATSDYIINELTTNIKKRRPRTPHRWLNALQVSLLEYSLAESQEAIHPSRDIKDDPIVSLAIKHSAVIITGDKDLLEYPHTKPPILSIDEYSEIFTLD